jgi:hypothetical protein
MTRAKFPTALSTHSRDQTPTLPRQLRNRPFWPETRRDGRENRNCANLCENSGKSEAPEGVTARRPRTTRGDLGVRSDMWRNRQRFQVTWGGTPNLRNGRFEKLQESMTENAQISRHLLTRATPTPKVPHEKSLPTVPTNPLPPLYAAWTDELLPGPIPPETVATKLVRTGSAAIPPHVSGT